MNSATEESAPFACYLIIPNSLKLAAKFVQLQCIKIFGEGASIAGKRKANQAILANLLRVFPGACIDSDDVACINEKRNLDGCSRF